MVSAIDSAVSGLSAATTRLAVSANNTANFLSTKSNVNGKAVNQPYTPQKVDQVSLSTGGTQALVSKVSPPTVALANPNSPTGTTQYPNVDLNREAVNQNVAALSYKANLKSIQVANNTLQSLLDIKT